jgi:hypothetical protein
MHMLPSRAVYDAIQTHSIEGAAFDVWLAPRGALWMVTTSMARLNCFILLIPSLECGALSLFDTRVLIRIHL